MASTARHIFLIPCKPPFATPRMADAKSIRLLFMEEFKVIDSAASAEVLKKKLKNDMLEQYGVFFEPKTVYDALLKFDGLRGTTRFEHMKVRQSSHLFVRKVMLIGICSAVNSRTPRNSLVSSSMVCMRNVSVPCT
jgi:hypothetical protein